MGKLQGVVVVVVVVEGIGGSRWMRPKSKSLETFFVLFSSLKVEQQQQQQRANHQEQELGEMKKNWN